MIRFGVRAAKYIVRILPIWDHLNKVYFRLSDKRPRNRPSRVVFAMREFPFPLFPVSRTFLATGIPVREISQFPPQKQGNEVLINGSRKSLISFTCSKMHFLNSPIWSIVFKE